MNNPFNGLTDAEAERLALLLEELGEAQQAIGKILRHGYDSYHPDDPTTCNRRILEQEIGDVGAALKMMVDAGDLSFDKLAEFTESKLLRVKRFLHHN